MEIEKLLKKRRILREIAKVFRVEEKDLPRVIARFKKELKEMEEKLSESRVPLT